MSDEVRPQDVETFQRLTYRLYKIKLTDEDAKRETIRLKQITKLICYNQQSSHKSTINQNSP